MSEHPESAAAPVLHPLDERPFAEDEHRIRSFVLRSGHVSNAQRRAMEELWPRFGVTYQTTPWDWEAGFGRSGPKILEIGFGMGTATAAIALAQPERNFLGVEVHSPGVGSLLNQIESQNISNLRLLRHDAVEVVKNMVAPNSLDGIHIFFPDPWPKKRHHKRRLIQPEFVALLASRLAPGGYLHLATDWENYAEQMLAVLGAEPSLQNTAVDYAPKPAYRPLTKFEARGLKLGHGVWDVVFTRRANPD